MLENDPQPGTPVYFVRQVRKGLRTLEANETATLNKRGGYKVETAADQFEVNYRGELFTVRRDEIAKIGS